MAKAQYIITVYANSMNILRKRNVYRKISLKSFLKETFKSFLKRPPLKETLQQKKVSLSSIPSKSFLKHQISKSLLNLVM